MTRIYCIRHGQSLSNAGGLTMQHAAIPLSPLGLAQAAALSAAIDVAPSQVLTSSYVRAVETAAPLCARLRCQAEVHPLLHEFSALDADQLQGMMGAEQRPLADAYWATADPHLRTGPKAETFVEFAGRVEQFMLELDTMPDDTILFGHGIWFGLLFWRLMGFAADEPAGMRAFRRFQSGLAMPNCAVYVLTRSVRQREWRVKADETPRIKAVSTLSESSD